MNRRSFLQVTWRYTLPTLVLKKDAAALEAAAQICDVQIGATVLNHAADVLSRLFLEPKRTDDCLNFLIQFLRRVTKGSKSNLTLSVSAILQTCMIPFVVSLIVELGDTDLRQSDTGLTALMNARRHHAEGKAAAGTDVGDFLKPFMLGVISTMNDMLHDVQGKKSVEEKRKIVRSLGVLIAKVGDSMASFSPQVSHKHQNVRVLTVSDHG